MFNFSDPFVTFSQLVMSWLN